MKENIFDFGRSNQRKLLSTTALTTIGTIGCANAKEIRLPALPT